jgi:DNA-binding transcriptional ArsR family regulator
MAADTAQLIMALNHPLRRQILRIFRQEEEASATALCQRFEMPLSNISYHVKVLAELKVLRLAHTRKVRGAKERFYRVTLDNTQGEWVRTVLEDTSDSDSRSPLLRRLKTGG